MNRDFSTTAALFSDPGRAAILFALLDGRALPAGELALIANVAPQTASSHLAKLVEGDLLRVVQQGRHRYYRLAHNEVAHAVEALLAVTPASRTPRDCTGPRVEPGTLAHARTCYSHLAGQVAVEIAEAMQQRGLMLCREEKRFQLTANGRRWLAGIGIEAGPAAVEDPRFARPCLDWTERRYHIAGQLGSAMLARFRQLKWLAPVRNSRAVRVTLEGREQLHRVLGVTHSAL